MRAALSHRLALAGSAGAHGPSFRLEDVHVVAAQWMSALAMRLRSLLGSSSLNARRRVINALKLSTRRAATEANKDVVPLGSSVATAVNNPAVAMGLYANSSAMLKAALARALYSGGKAAGPEARAIATYLNMMEQEEQQ